MIRISNNAKQSAQFQIARRCMTLAIRREPWGKILGLQQWNVTSSMLYSVRWYRSEEKCVLHRNFVRYLHNSNTAVITTFSVIKQTKFSLSSTSIGRVGLVAYVIYN